MKPFDSFHNPRRHKDDKIQALLKDNGFRKLFLQTLDLCVMNMYVSIIFIINNVFWSF